MRSRRSALPVSPLHASPGRLRRSLWSRATGVAIVASVAATMLPLAVAPAQAVDVPNGDFTQQYSLQTNGPAGNIGLGDYYTASAGGNQGHLLEINVPCGWPATKPIDVDLFSAPINTSTTYPGAQTYEEPAGAGDSTTFVLRRPNATQVVSTTYQSINAAADSWVRLATLAAPVACGTYELAVTTANDDQNGWRLRVGDDNDTNPDNVPPATGFDDADGVDGTNDEITVGVTRGSYQHDRSTAAGPVCLVLYEYVAPGLGSVSFHNFDMDNDVNAGSTVRYYRPSGPLDPTGQAGGILGDISNNGVWNNPGGAETLTRVGDRITAAQAPAPGNAATVEPGWWRIVTCASNHNQFVQEAQTGEPVYFEQPPTPRLVVAKTDGQTVVDPGQTVTYAVTINNTSTGTTAGAATAVVVTDVLPTGLTPVSCSVSTGEPCTLSGQTYTSTLSGAISAGASRTLTVVARVVASGAPATMTNNVSVAFRDSIGNPYVPVSATDVDTLSSADLSVTKTAGTGFTVGGNASYTLSVASAAGTGRTRARGITVTDTLPAGLSFVSASGAGWTCTAVGRTVTCTYAPDLAPGASAAVTLNVAVAAGAFPSVSNTATVSSSTPDPVPGNNSGSVTTPVTAASIGDRVFVDADADGIADAGEVGQAGVTVQLLAADGTTLLATATTGTGGAYAFTGLAAGTYVVQFVAPAGQLLSARDVGADDAVDSDADPANGRTAPITVTSGQSVTTVDAGLIAPASVGDLVYDDRDGSGTRNGTEPGIAGRTVVLSQGGVTVATTTTDANGAYLFSGLRPGTYVITTATPTGFTATGPSQSGVSVTLTAGQADLARDFGFRQTNASIGDTVYVDLDGDGTQDTGEAGRAGVTVVLTRDGQPVTTTTTGPGGAYLFDGLPAGSYAVTVTPPTGFAATTPNPVPVTLTAGAAVRNADVGIQQVDASIGDLVFTDLDGNGVLNGAETGRAGVTLTLSGGPTSRPAIVSGTGGAYAFTGLAAGTYTVTATPPAGFVGTTPLARTFTITAGQVVTTADFGVQQAQGSIGDLVFDDRNGNGLFDAGDAPLAGRTVMLSGPGQPRMTVTDANGNYLFSGLVAGSYTVTVATPTGFTATGPSTSPRVIALGGAQSVTDADFGFRQTDASIGDTVYTDTDADGTQDAGEAGRQGVTVELLGATGDTVLRTVVSGPGGAYSFAGLPAGSYRVRVVAPTGFVVTTGALVPVTLTAGQAITTVDLGVVRSDASIGDLVYTDTDADGVRDTGEAGRAGVVVRLSRDGVLVAQQTTTAGGAYSFPGLLAGTYSVTVDVPAGTVATRTLPLTVVLAAGDAVTDADIGLASTAGSIGDLVYVDADGDGTRDVGEIGLGGRTVTLTRNGAPAGTTVTDGQGAYLFSGLTAGTYVVTVETPEGFAPTGATRSPVTVQLAAAQARLDVDLGFQQVNASIGDTVYDDRNGNGRQDAGEPGLSGLTVTLQGPGGPASTTTGAGGAYLFSGLVEGAYTVTVTPPTGFVPTQTLPLAISLAAGQQLDTADLGLQRRDGSIGDLVFDDLNGNGTPEAGEPGLVGVPVTVTDAAGVVRTTTTGANGAYSVGALPAGTYTVTVQALTGYVRTTGPVVVPLSAGGTSVVADIGLQRRDGVIGDTVFLDLDGDGVLDAGEPGRGSVVVTLVGGPVPLTTTSAFDGSYAFTGLAAGTYTVSLTAPDGFRATTGPITVPLDAGESDLTADLGLEQAAGTIGDLVYGDTDANGSPDAGEPGYADVLVTLTRAGTDGALGTPDDVVVATTRTRPSGTYVFTGLPAGSYRVSVDPATLPGGGDGLTPTGPGDPGSTFRDVLLAADAAVDTADIGFVQSSASIGDRVFDDLDGDGTRDADEPGLGGVDLTLEGPGGPYTTTSDPDGSYLFSGLLAGTYTLTATAPPGTRTTTDPAVRTVVLTGNEAVTDADVGVQRVDAAVSGTVFTDADGNGLQQGGEAGLPGATVTLTGPAGFTPRTVTVAAGTGDYLFAGLPAGAYTVTPTYPQGYTGTTPGSRSATLTAGQQQVDVDFGARLTTGVISGTARTDVDGDGLADVTEPGVVLVLTGAGPDGLLDTDDDTTETTATDGAGRYAFSGLPAGEYRVDATAPAGTVVLSGASTPVTLAAGGVRNDVDVLLQQVDASIGDLVFTDVDGDGLFDAGVDTGLDGVTVVLDRPTGDDLVTVTAGGGRYLFDGLPAGSYTVDALVPAGFTATTVDPRPVTLTAGQEVRTADFGLQRTSAAISGTVFTDSGNDGQRTGDSGRPGVTVVLTRGGTPVATALTGPVGQYAFPGLPAGSYEVTVVPADGTVASTPTTLAVVLTTDPVLGQDFGLAPATGSIGDLVYDDVDRDGVRDPGEVGRQGATVTLSRDGRVLATRTSGPAGEYAFTGLPAGTYAVAVTPPDGFLLTAGQPAPVVLTAAQPSDSTVDVGVVQSDASIGDTVFSDDDGNGMQDLGEAGLAGVTLRLSGGPTTRPDVVTGAGGTYAFTGLVAGTYTITAVVPAGFTAVTPNPLTFTVAAGQQAVTADVALRPTPGSVTGLVFDDRDADGVRAGAGEAGLPDVTVELRDAAGALVRSTTTAGDGSYAFAGLPVGDYRVVFTPLAGTVATGPVSRPVTLTAAVPASAGNDLGLAPSTSSIGDLVFSDADGDGQQDAGEPGLGLVTVTLLRGTTPVDTAVTAADGSYLFEGLTAGDYSVTVTVPAGSTRTTAATVPVTLGVGAAFDGADFGLRQTDSSIGDLVFDDADGDGLQGPGELGLPGVLVTLTGPVSDTATTDADGRYTFSGLPAGRYTVDVTVPTGRTATTLDPRVVDLAAGQDVSTADFGLRTTSAAVAGTVFSDVDGDGVFDADEDGRDVTVVVLTADGVEVGRVTTGPDGSYVFDGLPAGTYTVQVLVPEGTAPTTDTVGTVVLVDQPVDGPVVGLQPVRGSIGDLVFEDTDGNGLLGAGETGRAGVVVVLSRGGVEVDTTTTDADGAYLFAGLAAGEYVVTVTVPEGSAATTPTALTRVLGPDGTVSDADVGVRRTDAGITGLVYDDLDRDGTRGVGDAVRPAVQVQLVSGGVVLDEVTSDADGRYLFPGLPAGSYLVRLVPPAGTVGSTDVPVTLAAGEARTGVDLGIRSAAIGDVVFDDLDGDGTQDAGEPGLPGTQVELRLDGELVGAVATGPGGAYLFDRLPAGTYTVSVTVPGDRVATGAGAVRTVAVDAGVADLTVDVGQQLLPNTPPRFTESTPDLNTAQSTVVGRGLSPLTAVDDEGGPLLYEPVLGQGALPLGITLRDDGTFDGVAEESGTFTIDLEVVDQRGARDRTTLTITVTVLAPPAFTTSPDNDAQDVVVGSVPRDVVATDPDGTLVTYAVTAGTLPAGLQLATDGSFTGAATTRSATPSVVTITATDRDGQTATTQLVLTVVGRAPVAVADTATTRAGDAVLVRVVDNDTDADGDVLVVSANTQGANGAVACSGGGCTYTPNAGSSGTDTFSYTVSDGREGTSTTTVTVTVVPNGPPVAGDDSATTAFETPRVLQVLGNDTDPEDDPLTVAVLTQPANGTVTCDGTTCTYVPAEGFSGVDSFTYTVSDGRGGSDAATVTLTVTADPNVAPVFTDAPVNDTQAVVVGGALEPVVATDADDLEADLRYAVTAGSLPPGVTLDPDGTFTGTPTVPGTYSATITVSDPSAASGSTVLTVTVTAAPVNRAPAFTADADNTAQTVALGEPVGRVLAVDPDGGALVYSATGDLPPGVTFGSDGTFTGTPNAAGRYELTIMARDVQGATATTVLVITVPAPVPANQDPSFGPEAQNTRQDVEVGDGLLPPVASDPEGGTLTFTVTGGALPPGVTLADDGTFAGTATNPGTFTVTITVTDPRGGSDVTTLVVVVAEPVNTAPVYTPPDLSGRDANTAQTVPVGGALEPVVATDAEGGPITYAVTDGALPSGVTLNEDGTFTGSPTAAGEFTVTIVARDPQGLTDTTVLVVTVPNRAPVAEPDTRTTTIGTPVDVAVLANDTDPDGDVLTVVRSTDPANGAVDCQDGVCTYTPAAGFTGTDTFTYTVSDGTDEATTTVTVLVEGAPVPGNLAPVFGPEATNTAQEVPVGGTLTAVRATDPDAVAGEVLTYALTSGTLPPGVTALEDDGRFTGSPTTPGTYTLEITVTDPDGAVDVTQLVITVPVPANVVPVAADDEDTTDYRTPVTVDVLANDVDADGDELVVSGLTQPANGSVTCTTTTCTYVPDLDFADGTDTFTYTVSDGQGGTDVATVTVTVGPAPAPNQVPVARPDAETTPYRTPVTVPVLANDTDADGGTLTVVSSTQPASGTVECTATACTYTPDADTAGVDDTFTYTVSDGQGGTATATVTITVGAAPVANVAPDAVADAIDTPFQTAVTVPVLGNDTDTDGGTLTVTSFTQPGNGSVSCAATACRYVPAAGFSGPDTFTYTVSDGQGGTDTATVTVTVGDAPAINAAPVAVADTATVAFQTPVTVPVLANDTDADGDALSVVTVTQPSNGSVTCTATTCRYVPNAAFSGDDTFTYTVTDGQGGSSTATVTVTVEPRVNAAPVAGPDTASTPSGAPVTVTVLANDTDSDGGTLSVLSVSQPANGSVSCDGTRCTYVPTAGFAGTDTFTYVVSDGQGGTATGTVTVTVVAAPNQPPAFTDAPSNTTQTTAIGATPVPLRATDPEGTALTFTVAGGALPTGVTLNPDGTFSGSPLAAGTYSVVVRVTDAAGGSATTTLTITVPALVAPNTAPVAVDDRRSTAAGTPVVVDVRANDTDADGDALTVTASTQPAAGTGTVVCTTTSCTFTPAAGFSGPATFTYTVSDGRGGSSTATVTVDVAPVVGPVANRAPVFSGPASTTVPVGGTVAPIVATDPEGGVVTLTVTGGQLPPGTTLNRDGTVSGSPTTPGTYTAEVTATDAQGATTVRTVTVVVPANRLPVAGDDRSSTAAGTPVTVTVLANDTDPDGDRLVVTGSTPPRGGTVDCSPTACVYTPDAGFSGTDTFTYTVSDGKGGTDTATVTVVVAPAPVVPPVAPPVPPTGSPLGGGDGSTGSGGAGGSSGGGSGGGSGLPRTGADTGSLARNAAGAVLLGLLLLLGGRRRRYAA